MAGISEDGFWAVVDLGLGQEGWVKLENITVISGTEALAVIESPPTPIPSPTQPIITKVNAWQGTTPETEKIVYIKVENFNPNEKVIVSQLSQKTGELVGSNTTHYNTKPDGSGTFQFRISATLTIEEIQITLYINREDGTVITRIIPCKKR